MKDRKLRMMTCRFFADDLDYLRISYPDGGYNRIVRALVARHVRALRNRTAELVESKLTDEEIEAV